MAVSEGGGGGGSRRRGSERREDYSGSFSQSRRGIAPSKSSAQDADRNTGEATQTPGSQGAERTRTTEVTLTQRSFIRRRTMSPMLALVYLQKQDSGRAQSRPPVATTGGPVPNGPQSQAQASSGPCPASSTTLPMEEDPRPSRGGGTKVTKTSQISDFTQDQ